MMAMAHLWSSVVSVMVAVVVAVPVPAPAGGTLTSLESRCDWAADVSARAARSWHWRVPAGAEAIARSGEGVRCSFCLASGLGR
jgi:hypothetical protein